MDGRAFLRSCQALMGIGGEPNWRSAVSRAYYALLHEGEAFLRRWGFPRPPGDQLHQFVRRRFGFTVHPELQPIGLALDDISRFRNQADYQLSGPGIFANATRSLQVLGTATTMIALLDAIDADPARRTAVIAALRVAWP